MHRSMAFEDITDREAVRRAIEEPVATMVLLAADAHRRGDTVTYTRIVSDVMHLGAALPGSFDVEWRDTMVTDSSGQKLFTALGGVLHHTRRGAPPLERLYDRLRRRDY